MMQDGHNELFNYSSTTGFMTTGPRDAGGAGQCVTASMGTPADGTAPPKPPTSTLGKCDAGNKMQHFKHVMTDGSLRLTSDASLCLSAGQKRMNAGVLRAIPPAWHLVCASCLALALRDLGQDPTAIGVSRR